MWGEGGKKVDLIEIQDIWWPPVMQSGRSRGTYGKIRDCEPSAKTRKCNYQRMKHCDWQKKQKKQQQQKQ